MAHFAKLDKDNVVVEVHVVNNEDVQNLPFPESEPVGIEFLTKWAGARLNWKQTSYNANFRKNYAMVGGYYDRIRDAFIPPKPYQSWLFNENTCCWDPPIPMPIDNKFYVWDEITTSWVEMI